MPSGLKNWDRDGGKSLLEKLTGKPPLKERLSNSIYRLKVVNSKLEGLSERIEQRDRELFSKCSDASSVKDYQRANIYAGECSELRKMMITVLHSQTAIEQVLLRLETVRDFGDLAVQMGPLAGVVKSLKGQLSGVMPEVSHQLSIVNDNLNELICNIGEATESAPLGPSVYGDEAQRILQEAAVVAEQKMKERLPDLAVALHATHGK